MALPFLPAEHIASAFEEVQTAMQDSNDTRLHGCVRRQNMDARVCLAATQMECVQGECSHKQ